MKPARLPTAGMGIVVGVLVALSLPAGSASAHADLLHTEPAAGTVVKSLPAAVTLTFSEAVQPVVAQIQVIAPDGSPAGGSRISTAAAATLRIPLREGGPDGTYAVSYRVGRSAITVSAGLPPARARSAVARSAGPPPG